MQSAHIDENRASTISDNAINTVAIVIGSDAPELERFAANELCNYLGKLFGIHTLPVSKVSGQTGALILVGTPETNEVLKATVSQSGFPELTNQGLVLRNTEANGLPALIVGGGSSQATLWAVYELVAKWGVHYLPDRDVLPEPAAFVMPKLDAVMEPSFHIRAHPTIQDFAASGESWGIADWKQLIDQLAKLKFNRLHLGMYGWQPFLHWKSKGIERKTASLWYDYHYHIAPDMIGREIFDDQTEFWNRDIPLTTNYEALMEAGEKLLHGIMAHAHERGMECAMTAPLNDFPQEFAPLLKGAERSHVLGGMTVVPGQDTPLDDPHLFELATDCLHAVVNTYPEVDLIVVGMPEYRQWTTEAERAWDTLDSRYGVKQELTLEGAIEAALERNEFKETPERVINDVKGDISSLYFYERLLRHSNPLAGTSRPDMRFVYWGPAEELYPALDHILPHNWEMEVMPSNQPSILLERIEVLKTLPRHIASVMCLTIDDDNIGVMPQLTTNSLHKIIQVMKRVGWSGYMARERYPCDHDWALAYLSQTAWNDDVTPDDVARDQVGAICGADCVEDMLTAFHEIEAATIALCVTNFAFPADWPPPTAAGFGGMFMKHWQAGPPPEPFIAGHAAYARALDAARRAQAKAKPQGRWYTDFWVGRLEFAERYMESALALGRAATAHLADDRPEYLRHSNESLAAMKAALEAYVPVVRNRTDEGAIATVNEHCYKALKLRNWSLHAHGY